MESQLITVTEDILYAMDHRVQTDVILLDFQKAFDTVLLFSFLLMNVYFIELSHLWKTPNNYSMTLIAF